MAEFQQLYRRLTDVFWRKFAGFTGWDPDPDQQILILIGVFSALVLALLALYLRQISRSSKRVTHRNRAVASYQKMRRIQNADNR